MRRKLRDPSSCRVKRCPSCSGEGGVWLLIPPPWALPSQPPCRASGDAVSLACSQWSRWCQVLGFIPGNEVRGSRSPSLVPRAAPAPQGERLLPCPPPAADSGARYQPHGFLISPALATHPPPVATTNPAWGAPSPAPGLIGSPGWQRGRAEPSQLPGQRGGDRDTRAPVFGKGRDWKRTRVWRLERDTCAAFQ